MYFMIFSLVFSAALFAEVEQVTLRWNPIPCNYDCPKNLYDRLSRAKGVASVEVRSEMGNANIVWDKKIPFSFVPLNWALRYVGVREKEVRVKVSGYIKGSAPQYILLSRGDNTSFVLFNRAITTAPSSQYVDLFNPTNRTLSSDQIAKLEAARKSNRLVTIEGPIFMPERSPPDPLRLVIDSFAVEAPPPTPNSNQPRPAMQSFGSSVPQ